MRVCETPPSPRRPRRIVPASTILEGRMDTLIDIAILLSVYASLSLFCAALMRVLWAAQPQRVNYESVTTRG
jgi:hypothetical protein